MPLNDEMFGFELMNIYCMLSFYIPVVPRVRYILYMI